MMENRSDGCSWKSCGKFSLLCIQSYFISIATVLGTGILGLPATLSKSGFYPFLLTFSINYLIQVLAICQMMEILQYARVILSGSGQVRYRKIPPEKQSLIENEEGGHIAHDNGTAGLSASGSNGIGETVEGIGDDIDNGSNGPNHDGNANFHAISKLFLPKWMHSLFLILLFASFIVIVISYALAGSEAYAQIFNVKMSEITPYFTWILALLVIFGYSIITPAIAVMTFAKGSLLFSTVVVTMYSGASISQKIVNDWSYVDKPLLMGIVALAGIVLVMPMLFENFQPVRREMVGFRNAVIAGLTTCFILNIMWCWAVLKIVPQTSTNCSTADDGQVGVCDPDLTLEGANRNGEIATVPLTKIILTQHKEMQWIAVAVQVFILISITVSFLTLGSAMQHTVSGWVDDFLSQHERWKIPIHCLSRTNFAWHVFAGLICFSVVFLVAIFNPNGFIVILERASSFNTNVIYGVFIFLWIRALRSQRFEHIDISLKTGGLLWYSHYFTLLYFTVVTVYDVVTWVIDR